MQVKIIVDASQFVHANFHIWKKAQNAATLADAIVANIQNEVFKISKEVPVSSVVLALDSRPTFRHTVFPEYKNRPPSTIEWDQIEEVLAYSFASLKCELLEADDLIYLYALGHHKKDDNVVLILSSDQDHYQTVDRVGCVQYCPRKGILTLTPEQVKSWRYKLLIGCKSDTVPSILPVKVGEKTIQKLFDKNMTVKDVMLHYKVDPNGVGAQTQAQLIYYDAGIYSQYIYNEVLELLKEQIQSL